MTTYLVDGAPFTNEDARAFAEAKLGRPLTDGERALDLVGLDLDLAEGKERLTLAIEEEKRRALERRMRGGSPRMEISEEIADVVAEIVEAGRRHAREEIERLTGLDVSGRRAFVEGGAGWLDRLLGNLITYLTRIRIRVNAEAGSAEFSGAGPITEELLDRLDDRIPGSRDAASRIVSGLFLGGLGEVYETNADLFPCFTYSAVMDGATCAVCRTYDGRRYSTWVEGETDLPGGGPNPLCLGDGRCRCRLVPCAPGERVGDEPEPEPEISEEIDLLRRAVDEFEPIYDDEFVALEEGRGRDVFNIAGGPSRDLQERVDHLKAIGRGIEDEANRRFGSDEDFDRGIAEWEARVGESRRRFAAEIERHYDVKRLRFDEIERELFGEAGARSQVQYDMVERRLGDDPEFRRSLEEHDRIEREHHALVRESERHTDPLVAISEHRRDVIAEMRATGGTFVRSTTTFIGSTEGYRLLDSERLYDLADDQARYLPSDWIEASNRRGFHVAERNRGHYVSVNRMVAISGSSEADRAETMLHELGHRMEDVVPEIRMWEWAFMWMRQEESRRNGTYREGRLRDLVPGGSYESHERAEPDDFAKVYTGRDYGRDPTSSYEILTMGLQGLFHGDVIDDDHRDFVLGLLGTIKVPPPEGIGPRPR